MRDLGQHYGESILVPQLCGTATQIAEQLTEMFTSGDADGFVISPALLPDSFAAFVEGRLSRSCSAWECSGRSMQQRRSAVIYARHKDEHGGS